MKRTIFAASLILAALASSNCARHLTDKTPQIQYSYARAAASFAAMSALVYDKDDSNNSDQDRYNMKECRRYLHENHWQRLPANQGLSHDCESDRIGLQYSTWINKSVTPHVMCVAFRGTEFTKLNDWRSNLRVITRPFFGKDQYDLVKEKWEPILAAKYTDMVKQGDLRIVTTGHSLGGGLSQCFRYNFPETVHQCYAFDPSPVTGYRDLPNQKKIAFKGHVALDGFPDAATLRIHQKGRNFSLHT